MSRPRIEPRFLAHPANSVLTAMTTRSRLEGKVGSISQRFLLHTVFLLCTSMLTSSDRLFRIVLRALHLLHGIKKKQCFSLLIMLYWGNKHSDFKTTAEMSSDMSTALNTGIFVLRVMTHCKLVSGYRHVGVSRCLLLLH